ncbi:MAG: hypothetical protein ABI808_06275 [Pseudonocardiales bacterium]
MGRHSAPEDDEPSDAPINTAVDIAAGRHFVTDEDDPAPTSSPARRETGTHGDLRLLRERPALRARCAAAAIVPFLLYTAVLAVIGRADLYLLWVWIPTVTAGIAVGGFLDAAHRHDRKTSAE